MKNIQNADTFIKHKSVRVFFRKYETYRMGYIPFVMRKSYNLSFLYLPSK